MILSLDGGNPSYRDGYKMVALAAEMRSRRCGSGYDDDTFPRLPFCYRAGTFPSTTTLHPSVSSSSKSSIDASGVHSAFRVEFRGWALEFLSLGVGGWGLGFGV